MRSVQRCRRQFRLTALAGSLPEQGIAPALQPTHTGQDETASGGAWGAQAMENAITHIIGLIQTLRAHATGTLNYFTHRILPGKLKGINNKIETLKRQACGFRDQTFFLLKLYSLGESSFKLTGC